MRAVSPHVVVLAALVAASQALRVTPYPAIGGIHYADDSASLPYTDLERFSQPASLKDSVVVVPYDLEEESLVPDHHHHHHHHHTVVETPVIYRLIPTTDSASVPIRVLDVPVQRSYINYKELHGTPDQLHKIIPEESPSVVEHFNREYINYKIPVDGKYPYDNSPFEREYVHYKTPVEGKYPYDKSPFEREYVHYKTPFEGKYPYDKSPLEREYIYQTLYDGKFINDKTPFEAKYMNDKVPVEGKFINDKIPFETKYMNDKVPVDGKFINDKIPFEAKYMNDKVPVDGKFINDMSPVNGELVPAAVPLEGEVTKSSKLEAPETFVMPHPIENLSKSTEAVGEGFDKKILDLKSVPVSNDKISEVRPIVDQNVAPMPLHVLDKRDVADGVNREVRQLGRLAGGVSGVFVTSVSNGVNVDPSVGKTAVATASVYGSGDHGTSSFISVGADGPVIVHHLQ